MLFMNKLYIYIYIYDLSIQFEDVPQETSNNEQVNVDQELPIERSLRRWDPTENREKEKKR